MTLAPDREDVKESFCWNCGKKFQSVMTSYFNCVDCGVTWSIAPSYYPAVSEEDAERAKAKKDEALIRQWGPLEFVDFTKPGAISCPA